MTVPVSVRAATICDIDAIRSVARASGARFSEIADPRIAACADDEPPAAGALRSWITLGRAWVALDAPAGAVGFVVVDVVDGNAPVEEIAVHPDHERRGHATALLDTVATWTIETGRPQLTLTTFTDVPWNRPYYERRGFRALRDAEVGPQLRARVAAEAGHGLPPELRVCMGRTV